MYIRLDVFYESLFVILISIIVATFPCPDNRDSKLVQQYTARSSYKLKRAKSNSHRNAPGKIHAAKDENLFNAIH
ncbi:hypothetical protein BOTCAL_0690g00020 [Botryotinia calthae]|uniref:Uncharacterized protein n=1 Tax=Botryotinia calthae TaxID=38488 RepID=A0A4Y8CH97_9HELO|nr:hypothetical protein BOTCAL_0690g00020 [Botryotinia calthae]